MSNQFRVEQDREVMLLIDAGRLMSAPLEDRTRLDAAVDAAVTVALVADEVGDRCGVVAFDDELRRRLAAAPRGRRRRRARAVRPRAAPGRRRLRARVPDRRGRQARADRDLLRPARGGGGAAARRRRAGARAPPRRARGQRARSRPRRPAHHAARHAPRDVYGQAVALDVLAARARVAHGLRARRARASSRRPPARCPPPACAPTSARRPAPGSEPAAPGARAPSRRRPSPTPTTTAPVEPEVAGHEALDEPGEHEPRHRAQHDLHRRPRLAPQRLAARQRPRIDERPADPQPRGRGDHDAASARARRAGATKRSSSALEPFSIARPDDRADEAAVEDHHGGRPERRRGSRPRSPGT